MVAYIFYPIFELSIKTNDMKRYSITVWNWGKKVFYKHVDFKDENEAEAYALGIFDGIRHVGMATGYKINELGLAAELNKESCCTLE